MIATIFRALIIAIIIAISIALIGQVSVVFNAGLQHSSILLSYFCFICYLFPVSRLLPLFVFVIASTVFKISIAITRTLWDVFSLRG